MLRDQAPFLRHPDARRIDLRATLRDPFGETHVRRFEQRSAIDVYAFVDVSASMGFVGAVDRFSVACDICAALAFSATRIGDRFGVISGGSSRSGIYLPASRSRDAALKAVEVLRHTLPSGIGAESLFSGARTLGGTRKLVMLISDFRWAPGVIESVFDALALHDVVPVVLVDSSESRPPRWGLLEVRDSESGRRRLMLMRPALQQRWMAQEAVRRQELAHLAAGRARAPIFIEDQLNSAALSQHLIAA
ncbi:hypothetical protein LMG27198_46140 [Methylocystis echinoides]|uniref:DUF58 domain-containing protein n=1 Tax=Methylocystis echinoides TaxID=29468 RepID=A0A9W6GYU4_9HYPH|nr:hypothetical protein LMG27198_46140 [Methylocystis echinoides]